MFYPTMYAIESENKDAKLFNCVQVCTKHIDHLLSLLIRVKSCDEMQRGHQNSLELMPMVLILLILGGIRHPVIAASLGAAYTVTRCFYFTGYSTGHPKNRLKIGWVLLMFHFILEFFYQYHTSSDFSIV